MQLGNKVKMERIIVFTRNRESAFWKLARNVFRRLVAKFCANFSRKRKFRFSLLSDAYIIITSMPMLATYRVKEEWIISEVLTAVLRESRAWKPCAFQVRERFPNFLLVIEICLVIPVRTGCCERGNSCLTGSCVTSGQHCVSTVEALMRLSINGVVSPDHYHWLTGWK